MPNPIYYANSKVGINNPNPQKELDITGDLAVSGTITSGGSPVGGVTMAAVGAAPNANGAVASGSTLTLEPADGTHPGVVTALAQTIGGAKTFSGAISASNLSGTNTGNVTLAAVGAVPNANGASLTAQALNLQPADGTNPGVVTTGVQTLAGIKTFSSAPVSANGFHAVSGAAGGLEFDATETYLRSPNNGGEVHFTNLGGSEYGKANARGFQTSKVYTCTYTDTSGTPGNGTANTGTGRAAFAALGTAVVITNNLSQAASVVQVTLEDLDATLLRVKVVPTDGSFTVTADAAATATCKFRWVLFNSVG